MSVPSVGQEAEEQAVIELLEYLSDLVPTDGRPSEALRGGGFDGAHSWSRKVEHGAAALGLRVRWMVAPAADAAELARPDLPVIGRSDAGVWWVLDQRALGRVHAVPIADPRGGRWMTAASLAQRIGSEANTWGLVEPVLPSAPLGSPDGRGRSPLRRLGSLLWVERRDVGVVVVYGIVAGLLSLATPLAIQVLINWLAFGALLQPIVIVGAALFVCLAFAACLQLLQRLGIETIERRIFVRTVADLSARLSRVRVHALDGLSGPELANRFFDVLTIQKAAGTLLLDGLSAALQVLVAVLILGVYHPWLLVFDVFLLLGMAVVLIPLGRGAQPTAIKESKAKYAVAAWIEEVARHPMMLRLDGSRLAEARADELARTWLQTRQSHFRVFLRQFAGVLGFQVLISAALLVTSGILVLEGQLTIGQLVAAEFIVTTALLGFAKFADKLDTVYDLLAGVDKLGSLLDLPPEPIGGQGASSEGPAEVELEGVGVRYPMGVGLPPVSMRLERGVAAVVVGGPGSGKSTLASVVAGIRTPTTGIVRHDGRDVRLLRPDVRFRGVMKVCPSDVLAGTVRDNLALGRPGVSDAQLYDALDRVGLRARVEGLPDGIDTPLGPSGAPLPVSDQRALLVARAIVTDPRLVVIDGLLDGIPSGLRQRLYDVLAQGGTWTTLLLTTSAEGLGHTGPVHHLAAAPTAWEVPGA